MLMYFFVKCTMFIWKSVIYNVMGTAEIHACANYSMRTFLFINFIIMAIAPVGSGHILIRLLILF